MLCPSLERLYDQCLNQLLQTQCGSEVASRSIGFIARHQTAEAVQMLVDLCMKSAEWKRGLVIIRCDIMKAFDRMLRSEIEKSLLLQGAEPMLVAAVLDGLLTNLVAHVGKHATQSIAYLRGGKQGGSSTPLLWVYVLHHAVGKILTEMEQEGLGYKFQTELGKTKVINHIIFADDTWLIAENMEQMREIFARATAELLTHGLEWKVDEKMAISINKHIGGVSPGRLVLQGGGRDWPFLQTLTVDCLGGQIDIDGDVSVLLEGRLNSMRAHFYSRKRQLTNKAIPLCVRLHRFAQTVRRTGLYLCGCFVWNQWLAHKALQAEIGIIRQIWGPKRWSDESWVEWQIRTIRSARCLLHRNGVPNFLQEALKLQHRWAGHVARADPDTMFASLAAWKSTGWWLEEQRKKKRADPRNRTGWRHWRPGPWPRWDFALHEEYGSEWMFDALERDEWRSREDEWVIRQFDLLAPAGPKRDVWEFPLSRYHTAPQASNLDVRFRPDW